VHIPRPSSPHSTSRTRTQTPYCPGLTRETAGGHPKQAPHRIGVESNERDCLGLREPSQESHLADRVVQRLGSRLGGGSAGLPLALGAPLDGIPEQAVLGLGLAAGQATSITLLVAILVSNLPESIGSST
jgi:hypothetical protein